MRLVIPENDSAKMLSGCLCCFAKNGGLLLHYRTYGGFEPLPLPVIASLNGAHDYLLDSQTDLLSFTTDSFHCTWREYHECLKFVVVMNGSLADPENRDLPVLLDFLWLVLIGHTGERTLVESRKDVDLLKRYVAQSARTLDAVMTDFFANSDLALGVFLGSSLFAYPSNAASLKSLVEIFCGEFSLTHCTIIAEDRLTILSTGLTSLNPLDLLLLVFAVSTNPDPEIVSEQLLFFPHFSANQAYRIIVMKLATNVLLTFFAGADFILENVQTKIESYWRNEVDAIKRVMDLSPKWLPSAVEQQLPPSLLGMLLWNTDTKRYFVSPVFPAATEEKGQDRKNALVTFYRMVSFLLRKSSEGKGPPIRDVYKSFDERKFYFLHRDKYQLFAMFDAGEPQHSLRHVTEIVLALCTKRHAAQPL